MNTLCHISATNSYCRPFRFIMSLGGQLQIDRINLPWGYIDNRGLPNVYIKDYQGNVRAVYNQYSGAVTQQTDYYPYGLPKAKSTNAEVNPFKYIGKELTTDLTNPFYDFEARMQLPTIGLFNRPDPKAGDYTSINTYSYCGGDPVSKIDLTGEAGVRIVDHNNKNVTIKASYFAVTSSVWKKDLWGNPTELKGYSDKEISKLNADVNGYLNGLNLTVPNGELKGYSITFDLSFEAAGNSSEANIKAENCMYGGKNIGNTIAKGNSLVYPFFKPDEVKNNFGENEIEIVGGVTDKEKCRIVMNIELRPNLKNLIHELFHTWGFWHPDGGGKYGIMHYPPFTPSPKDAQELIDNPFLPTLYR